MHSKRRFARLSGALAIGLVFAPAQLESQAEPASVPAWRQSAAARYLDGRMSWSTTWPTAARDHDTSCISCHTALPYAMARSALREALGESGPAAPEAKLLSDVGKRVTLWREVEPYYPDQTVGLPKTSESRGTEAILNALILASRDRRAGRTTSEARQAFENLWELQFTRGEQSGAWAWLHFDLAPWESDGADYFGAALAAVAVGVAPDEYAASSAIQVRLGLLRSYLVRDTPGRTPFDQVMLLWASSELDGLLAPDGRRSIIDEVVGLQNTDGGWSLASLGPWKRQDDGAPDLRSDGYATGLIAYVLQRAGVLPGNNGLRRALEWLAQNQDPTTGAWPAWSLNKERDPSSDRGRFMADAATAFAVLALTEAERPGG